MRCNLHGSRLLSRNGASTGQASKPSAEAHGGPKYTVAALSHMGSGNRDTAPAPVLAATTARQPTWWGSARQGMPRSAPAAGYRRSHQAPGAGRRSARPRGPARRIHQRRGPAAAAPPHSSGGTGCGGARLLEAQGFGISGSPSRQCPASISRVTTPRTCTAVTSVSSSPGPSSRHDPLGRPVR